MAKKKLKTGGIVIPEKINIVEYLEKEIEKCKKEIDANDDFDTDHFNVLLISNIYNDLLSKIKSGEIVMDKEQSRAITFMLYKLYSKGYSDLAKEWEKSYSCVKKISNEDIRKESEG